MMEIQTEGVDMMEDFIDSYVQGESLSPTSLDTTTDDMEDMITIEQITDVEATPFYPDGTEAVFVTSDVLGMEPPRKPQPSFDPVAVSRLQQDIDENHVLTQELKTSLNLLKATTSRMEREGRDHGRNIGDLNNEKTRLSNQLIDLEFQFQEQVALQDERGRGEEVDHALNLAIEARVQTLERMMAETFQDVKGQLVDIEKRMEINDQREEPGKALKSEELAPSVKPIGQASSPKPAVEPGKDFGEVLRQVRDCVYRTDQNDKKIATAWVGLIASLLLIPIAFLMGKFLE